MFRLFFCICLTSVIFSCSSLPPKGCSDDWKITGYYTPVEKEFTGDKRSVKVQGKGRYDFYDSFLEEVEVEGWGKTRYGWYLGYYGERWHSNESPLNSQGSTLSLGTVAVDPKYVPLTSGVKIPSLKFLMGDDALLAQDVGSKVKKKHVDVYTGEGSKAAEMTKEVTGNKTVCLV